MQLHHSLLTSCTVLCAVFLSACGGGGASGSSAVGNPSPSNPSNPNGSSLPRLFAEGDSTDGSTTNNFLKVCHFAAQKIGSKGQRGLEFLESLTVDVLSEYTAVLYNAQTGLAEAKTNRAYKGTDGKVGAPPALWTGVAGIAADGSIYGFGTPCTPTTMTTAPRYSCYWLVDNLNGRMVAVNNYDAVSTGAPMTSSGAKVLENPGWGTGTAYYFWYEMGPGANCSAPESSTLFRRRVRCSDPNQVVCN